LEHGAKSYLKNLTEYFTLLHDFSKLGDEECLFLINVEAITVMVNFYLGKKEEPVTNNIILETQLIVQVFKDRISKFMI